MNYLYNDNTATDRKIKQMIPILVQWARESWDELHYYGEMAELIHANPQSVGSWLGLIYNKVIKPRFPYAPALNALVCNRQTKLPGEGLDVVDPRYSTWDKEKQKKWVYNSNKAAHEYDWNPVLKELGLNPINVISERKLSQYIHGTKQFGRGGEGVFHEKLKEYILRNPHSIGILDPILHSEVEFKLLSQDKIDVYFKTSNDIFALEVKSEISNDADIIRGIFQAVKYKSLLEAQNKISGDTRSIHSILVISRPLHEEGQRIAAILDVQIIENFKI